MSLPYGNDPPEVGSVSRPVSDPGNVVRLSGILFIPSRDGDAAHPVGHSDIKWKIFAQNDLTCPVKQYI
ncbi:hypothetical protein DENIS_1516 [Desulfonema ishimotonii]|uniref:Uncharacterized protein n=1 Tax=Desulfonema ishimotonii TaxID=45657 RepID=A0A401FUB4_9BACT|nr:hypothetical protein [Desulfonema ishimotonii]GBC60559.1 hypothetical protein DENIS_1516 [Desulfonema ishimotonii]